MSTLAHFHFRDHWREIKRGKPGHRFQDRYERARRQEHKAGAGQRIFFLIAGFVCLAVGALLVIFPGPAIPFFFLAGAFLASESRRVAKVMDWAEVRVRKIVAWLKPRWKRLPKPLRITLMILGPCCSITAAYFFFRWTHG